MHDRTAALAATTWPAEDGGPERLAACTAVPGPKAGSASVTAVRHDPLWIMAVHATGERLLALRASLAPTPASIVEAIDPIDLAAVQTSEPLALGPFWPGGLAALADGSCLVVQGRHALRLDADLVVERHRELPHDAPYNSFVRLPDGTIATKDLRRPGDAPSTLSLLDPHTLEDRAAPVRLPEPCVARLSATDHLVVAVGVEALHRLRWDPSSGGLSPCADPLVYGGRPDQSFGWDPVVTAHHIWWMDNGDHAFQNGMTMRGNGVASGPVRLWRAPLDGDELVSVEVSGLPRGAITNPPLVDVGRGVVVSYDSANAVVAAFDTDGLTLRWRRELATAQHLVLYPDTGEVVANHFDPQSGDALAVVDIATGEVRCQAAITSPAQSVVFGAPGTRRDFYYLSLSTIARVEFGD
jgi:PQQ-like domain